MKKLLAKFKVGSVVDFGNDNVEANLTAVTATSEENKSFSIYTPNASLKMHITNPNALGFFVPSKEYVFTIEPSESVGQVNEDEGTFAIPDASDNLRDWLDRNFIKYASQIDYTTIRLKPGVNVFLLGRDYQSYSEGITCKKL